MENLNGKNKIIKKAKSLQVLILLRHKQYKIEDLLYALSCIDLLEITSDNVKKLQKSNPLLINRIYIRQILNNLYKMDLIVINDGHLDLSYSAEILVNELIKSENILIDNLIMKIKKIIEENVVELYMKLIKKEGMNYDNR